MPSFLIILDAAFVLFGAAYILNFASICGVKSRVAFIRVITACFRTFPYVHFCFYGYIFLMVVLVFKKKLLTYIISEAAKIF